MKMLLIILGVLLAGGAGNAFATYADKIISYGGAGQGKVVFDGRTHSGTGLLCSECHPALFATRKQALITTADHNEGRKCFFCHNGTRAFSECGRCHRK